MLKYFSILLLSILALSTSNAQEINKALIAEIQHYQDSLENDFWNPELSPLRKKDFENFEGLDFFPIDTDYYIVADFVRTPGEEPFEMPTTRKRVEQPIYEKYGEVHFTLNGQEIKLPVYQSHSLREDEEWKNYLFLPFKDATNGKITYGGGRYLELWYTGGDTIVVDFNRAYNPYCAYNYNYSCPIVPKANWLDIPIEAGERKFKH
ncbi:MAG TPA: hypothetical protein DEQ34_06950 [Balneolaceae bacterium]|nr:hypothetical protein [Balneolaceae bacterium]|tara:strand:- start:70908 stop:71528 length:621 start_codon:yes stop_codon:yes gene_type:complete